MEPTLEFWFEFASTYSYIAAMRIEPLCRDAGVALVWKPFLLGPIFALQGWETSHFNLNERRGAYMWRDLERLTAKFGLPWRKPSEFPRNTTVPARVACAIADEPWCGDFVRRVYVANFGEDQAIDRPDVIAEILTELGQPAADILARAESPQFRPRLRENTQRATDLGIFGSPNCIVNGELFWGEEALEDAIDWSRRLA
jgi:2-hydroxychromene-2-carboxylate isomerase